MAIPGNFLSLTTETIDPNTSGWLAKTNCTLNLGTGGRSGDGCLVVKSVAAGEMQARTYSSYPVVTGTTYAAFADASCASVPERIGIRWLNAGGGEINITWGLTTASASSTWHRISVGGVAPVGATAAQVLLSSSPTGAGVNTFYENVYFGWPLRLPGNLLSFNAEQYEVDTSGWAVESNGTVSRTAPMISWPVNWYYSGGEMVTLTVTANGDASALCTERPPVTPGTEYVAFGYLSPPTSTASVWVELRFYDAGGAQISASRSILAAPGTGAYRQIASAVAPTTAATASLAFGITSGTAGQAVRGDGLVVKARTATVLSSEPNDNVVTFSDSNFEQGIGQWTVASGAAAIARSTPWGAQAFSNAYSLTVTSVTATASTLRSGKYPVQELLNFKPRAGLKRVAGGWTAALAMRWYDASDTYLGTITSATAALPSDGQWYWFDVDMTAPAGAVAGQIDLILTATAASSTIQVDDVRLQQVLPSTQVTGRNDTASILLVLRGLSTANLMTVYRILPDGSRSLVRGRQGLLDSVPVTDDTFSVEDYEAPLGIPVAYRVEQVRASTGTLVSWWLTDPVTVDPGDRNYCWLKDPSRPQLNMRLLVKSAPDWEQPIEQSVMRIRGRQTAIVLSGERSGREGPLVLWSQIDGEREALRLLLSSGSPLLWQAAPGMGESDVYVSVGNSAFPRVTTYAPEPWREWTLPLIEVDRPLTGVAGSATWTVQDVLVENATVLSLLARYATVLDLALDQRTV
ncbi:hypothetical protein [Streptomyces sp. NRRL F-5135]|uniref:hypothetical protein n=1 Tax=Streptomyces sp. NRRL F-5135 TaxID=1463858 RepID=UPI0004CA79D5|nr:hypothetical protein [Streptomyces sp. NRRL F-5135]